MYQRAGKVAYKADLQNTIDLDNHLGNPHRFYKTIHIAGTNGKGSTSHMIASVLQEAGYKVGLYTSPHLKDFRERIRINGTMCSEKFVIQFVEDHKDFFENHRLSFFEMTVGMAFQYFKEKQVDIAVIETGLGGRLDSTNIITPVIAAITNIDKDHTAILGNTYSQIAFEKAGIIKENVPVVIGEQRSFLKSRFRESAQNKNSLIHFIDQRSESLPTDLKGDYQKANSRLAVKVITLLNESKQVEITDKMIKDGLLQVAKTTGLQGRYQILDNEPKTIADTAHNVAGIKKVIKQVQNEVYEKLHIVLGMVSDKDAMSVIRLLPQKAHYYISRPDIPRGMEVEVLADFLDQGYLNYSAYDSVDQALKNAQMLAGVQDLILITGSTFVVAEII
ncbi:MAG: folylpolyglutamate synthase/dihydrofolate synthase family protein [Nonlabens sp.]|uniref:bifunctional folylpolyglutamate synthase/dihydrofolate synthase n=1 Tax=Nonlabens sp. TaxID=1888209 RepID=UPI003219DBB8